MKKAAIELLVVMLEDTDPGTKKLAKRIRDTLKFEYLDETIGNLYCAGDDDLSTMRRYDT